jgi:predicted transcriptional regulator of viral defense system
MPGESLLIKDMVASKGCSPGAARVAAHRLVRAGALERLARGIYRRASGAPPPAGPPYDLVEVLAPGAIVSHASACALHGLCAPPATLTAFGPSARRLLRTARGSILLLRPPRRPPAVPVEQLWEGVDVRATALLPSVLDVVDAPRHAGGGIAGVLHIVAAAAPRLSPEALMAELRRRGVSALSQRLGLLLERAGLLRPELRDAIRSNVRPGVKVHLGPRGGGRLDAVWNVVVNVPLAPPAAVAPRQDPPAPPGGDLPVALL